MGDWSSGLCGCFSDFTICLLSTFIPCYQVGKNAEAVGESCLTCGLLWLVAGWFGFQCIVGMIVRGKVREAKGIEGSGIVDFLLHWFCGCCAIAQEGREVQGGGQSMARE